MAKGRKDLALQIALILFVLLTIGVSVTSYIFYDKYRTEIDIRVAAVQATEAATKEANKAKEERDELKQLVGKGPAAGVTEIMGAFKRHQDAYGGTLPDEAARVYPTMLENQQDQIRKLQEDIISFQDAIKAQKTQFDQAIKQEQTKVAALQKDFTA
ncbi:MAG: hypothetical protein GTO03_01775, partial [Planctomycetales bacterium]|nr:hypothetical protein [Planctomycetales bacterium]